MFLHSASQALAAVGALGVALHLTHRLSRLPTEGRHLRRGDPSLVSIGVGAFVLWLEAFGVFMEIVLREAGWLSFEPVFVRPARPQIVWLTIVWSSEAAVGLGLKERGLPVTMLWRIKSSLISLGWLCAFILTLKYSRDSAVSTGAMHWFGLAVDVGLGALYAFTYITGPCRDGLRLQSIVFPDRVRRPVPQA
ncbi:MAG: hypothetical protein U0136_21345 [Bdellovibrionota bacterium]